MIREEKGQSIVEFALVVPILLMLLIGIVDIGRLTFVYSSLHFTAQETVRVAGIGGDNLDNKAKEIFNAGDDTKLQVNPSISLDNRVSGEYITVTVTYPFEPLTPFVSTLFSEEIMLSADSTIRIE